MSHFNPSPVLILLIKRVFTDANLDRRDLKTVNTLVDFLIQKAGDAVDDLTYLALEWPDRNLNVCNYYFVQHDKQLLFWVHDFEDPMRIYENVEGVKSDTHISWCPLMFVESN